MGANKKTAKACSISVAVPSFRSGASQALDLFGRQAPTCTGRVQSSFRDDAKSLRGDWRNVGNYMRRSMRKVSKELS